MNSVVVEHMPHVAGPGLGVHCVSRSAKNGASAGYVCGEADDAPCFSCLSNIAMLQSASYHGATCMSTGAEEEVIGLRDELPARVAVQPGHRRRLALRPSDTIARHLPRRRRAWRGLPESTPRHDERMHRKREGTLFLVETVVCDRQPKQMQQRSLKFALSFAPLSSCACKALVAEIKVALAASSEATHTHTHTHTHY